MDWSTIAENLTNPSLLFFFLGIMAVRFGSTLSIPAGASRFISVYLLFSIGFKGGQELAHEHIDQGVILVLSIGLLSAFLVPVIVFNILKRKLTISNSAAIAAAYGSVSAVTFITAVAFLEQRGQHFGGHMVALMAMMEAPAIIVGVTLMKRHQPDGLEQTMGQMLKHALTNGSVFLLLGSTVIGFVSSEAQAQGIAPFTTDIFKGFLALFLLDMGIQSGKHIQGLWAKGPVPILFALIWPLVLGSLVSAGTSVLGVGVGDRLLLTVLVASASYIAVPAAMKMAIPDANPGLFTPMALALTFPINIILGIPLYYTIINATL